MHKISILWGEYLYGGEPATTYSFDTEPELQAFMYAVRVMDGYFGCPYKIVEEGFVYREEEEDAI